MKFFLDTADIKAIEELYPTGLVDGVTTNPSIIAKNGQDFFEVIKKICELVAGPVSAEVIATEKKEMIKQGLKLAKIANNVAVKVPLTFDGLQACYALRREGIMVNVTLCFNAGQALMAAKAGASFISPFVGRLDDIGHYGMDLIQEIREIFSNYPEIDTEILAASIRHPLHIIDAARIGADIATVPPEVLKKLIQHPLTTQGINSFLKDWEKTGQAF